MTIERITFQRTNLIPDGLNGTIPGGVTEYACQAEIIPLKSTRSLEANQNRLSQGYKMIIWVSPKFEPQTDDTIIYRDEKLVLQGFSYTNETRRKYELTAMEGAKS